MCHDYAIFVQQLPPGICIKANARQPFEWQFSTQMQKPSGKAGRPSSTLATGSWPGWGAAHAPRRVTAQFGQAGTPDGRPPPRQRQIRGPRQSEPAGCRRLWQLLIDESYSQPPGLPHGCLESPQFPVFGCSTENKYYQDRGLLIIKSNTNTSFRRSLKAKFLSVQSPLEWQNDQLDVSAACGDRPTRTETHKPNSLSDLKSRLWGQRLMMTQAPWLLLRYTPRFMAELVQ